MSDLLPALGALLAVTVAACMAGAALLVVPFVLAVDLAERRGFSPARWGACSLAAAGAAVLLARTLHGAPRVLLVVPLALTWAAPAALSLLEASHARLGGLAGRHE